MKRDIVINNIYFTIADYRARRNEFEKGLKYQVLKKTYDCPARPDYFSYHYAGYKGCTINECKKWIADHYLDFI